MTSEQRHEGLVQLLASSELFGRLSAETLAECAASFRVAQFSKGELIFARGDPGARIYLVAEGQVRLAVATSEGRELSFEIAGAGQIFGELAALDASPRSAEATALTEVKTFTLDSEAFRRQRLRHPDISEAAIALLCRRLRRASDNLENIALYALHVRLARFLLYALGDRQAPPGRRIPLALDYSQGELAQLLGASRPKVNAAFGLLEKAGAIGRTSDRVFCDRTKLAALAQKDDAEDA